MLRSKLSYIRARKANKSLHHLSNPLISILYIYNFFYFITAAEHMSRTRDVTSAKVVLKQSKVEEVSSKPAQVSLSL